MLGTVRRRLADGMPIDALAQVIALWAWSTRGVDAAGRPRAVLDPLAGRFAVIATDHPGDQAGDTVAFIDALLAIDSIFGDLSGHPVLRAEVVRRYHTPSADARSASPLCWSECVLTHSCSL